MRLLFQLPVSNQLVEECRSLLRNDTELPEVAIEPAGPQAAIEWALPAVLVILIQAAHSSFLDGFFEQLGLKRLGKQAGCQVAKRLTRVLEALASVERQWTASLGKVDVASPRLPLLKILHHIDYKIENERRFTLGMTFIFMDNTDLDNMESSLKNAQKRVEVSSQLLEEARRDAVRAGSVPGLYIGSHKPDIASAMAFSRAQAQSKALTGSFVFDVQERRWLKVH